MLQILIFFPPTSYVFMKIFTIFVPILYPHYEIFFVVVLQPV